MNRNQLKYFVAAAESRSFTKAAEQFYISQTAITQQIRLLEEALGCPLFDRSTRPVSLTPAGTIFLREAKGILERMSRASGYVPETVRNLRTIRTLGKETYMETRYDGALGESYRAIEGTNFYDALYSPVILTVNAAVVGAVMLLSASGKPAVLTLFGMTAGTAVTVMNYISQIFSPLESLGMEIQTIPVSYTHLTLPTNSLV